MHKLRAFTLIELLVVVSIIGLLIGITLPSLRGARESARKTVCKKNLATIGVGIHAYLMAHRDTFFHTRKLKITEEEAHATDSTYVMLPSLPETLKLELHGKSEVFLCPSDRVIDDSMAVVVPTQRYFDNEDTSYEWQDILNGERMGPAGVMTKDSYGRPLVLLRRSDFWMLSDFELFHTSTRAGGAANYLYLDLHVDSPK